MIMMMMMMMMTMIKKKKKSISDTFPRQRATNKRPVLPLASESNN
jgi:hypothetical protein